MEALLQSSSFVERESFSEESNVGQIRKCLSGARDGLELDWGLLWIDWGLNRAGLELDWS